MESPAPGFRYIAQIPKVFPGGSSASSGFKEAEILETAPSSKLISTPSLTEKKEVACEMIDLDLEEDCENALLIKGKTDVKGKGKEISSDFSVIDGDLWNDQSKNVDVDDPDSNLFFEEDEMIDMYFDDTMFDGDRILESQFDHIDIPPGVEVPFPWLSGGPQMTTNSSPPPSWDLKIQATSETDEVPSSFKKVRWDDKELVKKVRWDDKELAKKVRRADKELAKDAVGSMFETGWGLGKSSMVPSNTSAYLNSENGNISGLRRSKRKYFGSNVFNHSPNPSGWTGTTLINNEPGVGSGYFQEWKNVYPDMVGPPGFMRECDFTGTQNGETLVHSNLDEILRDFEVFKKFDTSDDYSDHYYHAKNSSNQVNPPKNWAKRIQEEWKILENDLPDKIFVRVYETRMDLLRAVIVGAEGTPYHDGLFFFDVLFPESYPSSPPQVYYHSGGLRLNPNLYNCGKVCLSLLNTWPGNSQKERWIRGGSTMLQVLVSIQGLILNAEPFYNEPGNVRLIGTKHGKEQSLQYNETTFIYSLQTMVYTMKRPPKHFEALVVGHFCKHAHDILVSCRAGVEDVDKGDKNVSDDFKYRLSGFITALIDTFSKIGAKDLEEFRSLDQKANNGPPPTAAYRFLQSYQKIHM